MKVKRSLRVSELIKREISEIIANKVRDRQVKNIIVTHVKVTDDLKIAKVYYRLIVNRNHSIEDKKHPKNHLWYHHTRQ